MTSSRWKRSIMNGSLPDRLEYAAAHACDPACEGRCLICPAEVMREAASALRDTLPRLCEAQDAELIQAISSRRSQQTGR
jgi:hypothetical protein